eukprot:4221225-Pleurochrysis_carterae.AAC.5
MREHFCELVHARAWRARRVPQDGQTFRERTVLVFGDDGGANEAYFDLQVRSNARVHAHTPRRHARSCHRGSRWVARANRFACMSPCRCRGLVPSDSRGSRVDPLFRYLAVSHLLLSRPVQKAKTLLGARPNEDAHVVCPCIEPAFSLLFSLFVPLRPDS